MLKLEDILIYSFICGSRVVIIVSIELLAFSATLARTPFPGRASFIQLNMLLLLVALLASSPSSLVLVGYVGLPGAAISNTEGSACHNSVSATFAAGRTIGRFGIYYINKRNINK